MPFEVFKPPKVHEAIATTVGKSSGIAISKGLKTVTGATNKMRANGCPNPAELAKVSSQLAQVGALSGTLTGQLAAFKAIPAGLKAPVGGIRGAVSSILSIAIPQAFPHVMVGPPGLPVSITLQFYDLCNMLKEMAAAFELTADAVGNTVSSSEGSIQEIARQVKTLQAPVKACKINHAIEKNLSKEQAGKLGLLDKNGELITSTIGAKILEPANTRPASEQLKLDIKNQLGVDVQMKGTSTVDDIAKKAADPVRAGVKKGDAYRLLPPGNYKLDTGELVELTGKEFIVFNDDETNQSLLETDDTLGDSTAGDNTTGTDSASSLTPKLVRPDSLKPGGLTGQAQALAELNSALQKLSDRLSFSNDSLANELGVSLEVLESLKNDLTDLSKDLVTSNTEVLEDPEYTYKGYLLKIIRDPESPRLAPKHFAVAIKNGKQEIKGPSSFSSSKEILLDEIKFRIDQQLS